MLRVKVNVGLVHCYMNSTNSHLDYERKT